MSRPYPKRGAWGVKMTSPFRMGLQRVYLKGIQGNRS